MHLYPGSWPPTFNFGKNVYLYIAFGNIYYGGELDMREIKLPGEVLRKITSPTWTKTIHYQHQLTRSTNMCHALTIHPEYCWIGTQTLPSPSLVPVSSNLNECFHFWYLRSFICQNGVSELLVMEGTKLEKRQIPPVKKNETRHNL